MLFLLCEALLTLEKNWAQNIQMIQISNNSNRAIDSKAEFLSLFLSLPLSHTPSLAVSASQLSGSEGIFSLAHLALWLRALPRSQSVCSFRAQCWSVFTRTWSCCAFIPSLHPPPAPSLTPSLANPQAIYLSSQTSPAPVGTFTKIKSIPGYKHASSEVCVSHSSCLGVES